ncbi:MAG: heavy metal translocating P-type ATPase [Acidimicrobiia bacterium]|nr:heavy metal translocating P-type ATPase [Acidimicrobiia bacterium]
MTHSGHDPVVPTTAGDDANQSHDKHEGHSPEMFRDRLWVSLALTVPILYFSTQIQEWFGYQAVTFPGDAWVSPILATVLFFYGGIVFLRGGYRELRDRVPGMMVLISIAITVAYVYSVAVSLGLDGKPFYWELATLLDVMLLGHWMEMRSVQSASRALEHLASMVPSVAHRVGVDGAVGDVPVADLVDGDSILIRPGEQVPADGDITEGDSSMNEAFLTGESRPVMKGAGDEVVAGAVNGEGALTVRVTRTGEATTLSQIMRLVEEAQASRSRFQMLADRAAYWLTIIAVGVSLPTLIAWLVFGTGGIDFAVARAVTVLVIACPHALGLAIPLVNMNATSLSARNGILVRNREAFERGRSIRFVAFDKTGTLTEGRFEVSAVEADDLSEDELLRAAASLERSSEHPLAAAIVEATQKRNLELATGQGVTAVPGYGLEGRVNGRRLRLGRPEWAEELGAELSGPLAAALEQADRRGESAVVMIEDQRTVGVIALADKIRDTARDAVARLRELDVTPVMVTGDAEAVAATVAAELGIDRYYARVLPADKGRIVRELKLEGPTAFVGDGINDAPALLEADLGIAIGAGTNVAIESADLVLVDDDPSDVVRALVLSRATHRKMIQNLAWATGYNTIAIPLAAGVAVSAGILLNPAVGALLMSLSTVIVAINAMLLRRVQLD